MPVSWGLGFRNRGGHGGGGGEGTHREGKKRESWGWGGQKFRFRSPTPAMTLRDAPWTSAGTFLRRGTARFSAEKSGGGFPGFCICRRCSGIFPGHQKFFKLWGGGGNRRGGGPFLAVGGGWAKKKKGGRLFLPIVSKQKRKQGGTPRGGPTFKPGDNGGGGGGRSDQGGFHRSPLFPGGPAIPSKGGLLPNVGDQWGGRHCFFAGPGGAGGERPGLWGGGKTVSGDKGAVFRKSLLVISLECGGIWCGRF